MSRFEHRLLIALGGIFFLNASVLVFLGLWFSLSGWLLPLVILFVWIVVLWGIFWKFRSYQTDCQGRPLQKLGIPNLLGLIRLISLPLMIFLFFLAQHHRELVVPTIIIMSVIFLTDFFDGYLARVCYLETRFGQILDSSSDYVALLTFTGTFIFYGLIPPWLLIVILVRLLFQVVGIFWAKLRLHKYLIETTFLGKLSLATLMVLYVLKTLVFLQLSWLPSDIIFIVEIITGALMVLSLADKIVFFRKNFSYKKMSQEFPRRAL